MPNGVAITHRVVRIGEIAGETYLETRGDANDAPDPVGRARRLGPGVVALACPWSGSSSPSWRCRAA